MSEPLWSDNIIHDEVVLRVREQKYWAAAIKVATNLRDEYEARITELEQEQVTLWHTINTQATYAEELEAQLAESREDYRVADNENGRLREFKQLLEAQLAEQPAISPDVRGCIRKLTDYGMPLGATNHDWKRWRDITLAWLDAQEPTP